MPRRMQTIAPTPMGNARTALLAILIALVTLIPPSFSAGQEVQKKLKGFDEYVEKLLKDWNIPGIGVGIVVKDKLVLAKGYGYRDFDKKLPLTPNTLYQIASNTKLFTTTAVGLLVEEGKLDWDRPVRNYVPDIQFFNDELNNTITIRDMLAHRTGISRHDLIWYKSDFTRKELFERLKFLEPSQPPRQGFLYNNMMYAGAGYIVELLTQKTWEDFVRGRIFKPLDMSSTIFKVKEMEAQADHGVPYAEKRDTTILYQIPIYEEADGVGPAGSIISNVQDMSHWLIALMNDGRYDGKQVIPSRVVKASLAPSIALPNNSLENRGYKEIFNSVYGMGRWSASYRGHYLAYHGGDLPGFHSQISCMPYDSIGAIVFVIGDHGAPLYNYISYNVYERLLGLTLTPWSERGLADRAKGKAAGKEARKKAGGERVAGTHPSHPLADYAGQYEHQAYGIVNISAKDTALQFDFHKIVLPLSHFHYDRFDTPDDELYGLFSLSFGTSPQGNIDRLTMSIDEGEATFVRKADATLSDPKVLAQYSGKYVLAGATIEVLVVDKNLYLAPPGAPRVQLVPFKPHKFRVKEFADLVIEFVLDNGQITALKQTDPSGEYRFDKKR